MIDKFVERFDANRKELRDSLGKYYREERYGDYVSREWDISYKDIVREVISILADEDNYGYEPDPNRIHQIDDGDYQGTLLFVIAANDYHPDDYWYVKVNYGSCSGCDTLMAITEGSNGKDKALDDLMMLALHIVQRLKKMEG